MLNRQEGQQKKIKTELDSLYEEAVRELEQSLAQAKQERNELCETLDKLRQDMLQKRAQNEFTVANNVQVNFSN